MSNEQQLFQCPCCDYYTLPKRGVYEICPICYWEDEFETEINDLDTVSDANHITLREARMNFRQIGAYAPRVLEYVLTPAERSEYKHEPRDLS